MPEPEYERLAADVLAICRTMAKPCILHAFPGIAQRLGCVSIHLPLPMLRSFKNPRDRFEVVGVSVHSVEEAAEAERLGATYLDGGAYFSPPAARQGLRGAGWSFCKGSVTACACLCTPSAGLLPKTCRRCCGWARPAGA